MISKKHKCIFIHIHKTGGTSIEHKLGHFEKLERDVQDHRTISQIYNLSNRKLFLKNSLYTLKNRKFNRSCNYLKYAIYPEITKAEFYTYYKFTFVRNTWSRMFSWYINVMRDELLKKSFKIYSENYSFSNFLNEKVNHEKFSQLNFIKLNNGKIPLDFIGRFENLQSDFNIVCNHLNISDPLLPKFLVRNHPPYSLGYDNFSKDLVYKYYREEIEYFGFEFGE